MGEDDQSQNEKKKQYWRKPVWIQLGHIRHQTDFCTENTTGEIQREKQGAPHGLRRPGESVRSSANGALMMKPTKEMSSTTRSLHQDRTRYLCRSQRQRQEIPSAGISMLKGVGIMDQQSASSSSSSWMTGDTHIED